MNSAKWPTNEGERERILAELVRREAGVPSEALAEVEQSTIGDIEAQLDTLVEKLREPPPADDFAEEVECRRATEFVKALAEQLEFSSVEHPLEQIGPYQLGTKLGQGGMGTVYQAIHSKLKRVVAIKILPVRRTTRADAIARFEREMAAIGALHHPNIVTAYDAGEIDGMQYLVMEYVDGLDLSTLSRRVGPLAVADACDIIRHAACGLAEAHKTGMVHRDIKPSNIMLAAPTHAAAEPTVKILDFGLALLAPPEGGESELTAAGQVMGTLNYMSPEQGNQSHVVDARADIYSLGATLYRLLSGQPPFAEKSDSPWAVVTALATEEPAPLSTLRSDLPPRLIAIVTCMMAKKPEDRYSSADEVAQALTPWGRGAELGALLERARDEQSMADVRPESVRFPIPVRRVASVDNRPSLRAILLGGGLLLAAAAVFLFFRPFMAEFNDSTPSARDDRTGQPASGLNILSTDFTTRAREVAEWLVPRAGEIEITTAARGSVTLQPGEKLPADFIQLITANLDGNQELSNEDLARFDKLPLFWALSLGQTKIDEAGLRHLGELPLLQALFLPDTFVADAGLRELQRYPKIEVLHLHGTQVTDAGLVHLADLRMLYDLSLGGCSITDAGLKQLTGLKRLRILALNRTGVTPLGIAEIQQSLPDCEIRSDYSNEELAEAHEALAQDSAQSDDR